MFISNICRADLPTDFLNTLGAGITQIPEDILPAREMKIAFKAPFTSMFDEHRGESVQIISSFEAARLESLGSGERQPQGALVIPMADYIANTDICGCEAGVNRAANPGNPEELARAEASDEELVLVAIIGGDRGPVTVLRNFVNGHVEGRKAIQDAEKALKKTTFVLIED